MVQAPVCSRFTWFRLMVSIRSSMTNYERVSDHCSNIAVAMIELSKASFGTHEYLDSLKAKDDPAFRQMYAAYKEKYAV